MAAPEPKCKILCVDDELMLAELCEERLQALGHDVIGETDAEKALRLLEESPEGFDLLIVDHVMPRMHGIELAKRAISINPNINVLLVTGNKHTISEEEVRQAGVKEVLTKTPHQSGTR